MAGEHQQGGPGRLDGKVAIVTGGARGSGQAIARRFVAEGARVVVADVLDDRGKPAVEELGPAALYRHCDVSEEQEWDDLTAYTVAQLGRLDVLVNNAAVLHINLLRETTVDAYLRVFRVNELGTFLGIRAAIEPMKRAGGGSIVNISSIDGHYAAPRTSAYSASKFAVRGLTKVAALELGRLGIRVNAICPAAGNPEMVMESLPPAMIEAYASGAAERRSAMATPPVGRFGTVEDVAAAALFLASDDSAYFTGADFMLDGGTTSGMHIPDRME
jgi:3alpha(or 20beta)-hydroxysteroid dehydrogenase